MLTFQQLKDIRQQAIDVILPVGKFIRDEINKVAKGDIVTKELNSLVSYVDRMAEQQLVDGLGKLLPEAGFITEEKMVGQANDNHDYLWVIDPLDGTTNYLQGLPIYSTSVALMYKGKVQIGIVNDIPHSDVYHAVLNDGAYCNDRPIHVSNRENLHESIVVTGFPYERESNFENMMRILEYFIRNARGIRRFGSAAIDLAYVAAGKFDAYYETQLNLWDVAGGTLIVTEAGGKVSDYLGQDGHLPKAEVVAANPALHPSIIEGIGGSL